LVSNVELVWESEQWARVCRHGGEHHQVVMIDKRGSGLSDGVAEPPSLEVRVMDTLAVMDAEDIATAHLIGQSEGASIASAIAARFPERAQSLTLIGSGAPGVARDVLAPLADDDDPLPSEADQIELWRSILRSWGSPQSVNLDAFAPTVAGDVDIQRWYQRFERHSASPAALRGFLRSLLELDVRPFLTAIDAPTLILHMRRDRIAHVANARYLHSVIPRSRYIEYDGDDHLWMFSPLWRELQDDVIDFITGARPAEPITTQFAIILFSDIVDSTRHEAAVGDAAWSVLLDRHDELARTIVERAAGRLVKQTGDGLLAVFPEPTGAARAARELTTRVAELDLRVRCGLHAGVIELRHNDVTGIAVNIAARVQSHAGAGQVLASDTFRDLMLGSSTRFDDLGPHELKGLDGNRRLYALHTGQA